MQALEKYQEERRRELKKKKGLSVAKRIQHYWKRITVKRKLCAKKSSSSTSTWSCFHARDSTNFETTGLMSDPGDYTINDNTTSMSDGSVDDNMTL